MAYDTLKVLNGDGDPVEIRVTDSFHGSAHDPGSSMNPMINVHADLYMADTLHGSMYEISSGVPLDNDGYLEMYCFTSQDYLVESTEFVMTSDANPYKMQVYESPTVSNNGTPFTARNRNRNVSDTTHAGFYGWPTITDLGTLLATRHLIGGADAFGSTAGISYREKHRWVFKPNTGYLIRLQNISGEDGVQTNVIWSFKEATI